MNKSNSPKSIENVKRIKDFSFAKNTTYACGGNAEIAYYPNSIKQATAVYDYLISAGIEFVTLGNGSNVLASDKNFDGAVICTKHLSGVSQTGPDTIFCYAGTKVAELLKYCVEFGFSGLEYLAGIPATVGGLVYMNGGAGGVYIADNIVNVLLYNGTIHKFSNKKCNFGYKYSIMRDINGLILGVELKVFPQSSEKIRENMSLYLNRRKFHPKGSSCGCVFKNVGKLSAGKIIEDCGLKGFTCGEAIVSEKHANFLINNGGSAADVFELIKTVKKKVFEKTGIMLEEEVVYIGDF